MLVLQFWGKGGKCRSGVHAWHGLQVPASEHKCVVSMQIHWLARCTTRWVASDSTALIQPGLQSLC